MIKVLGIIIIIIIDTVISWNIMYGLGIITFYPPIKFKTKFMQNVWETIFIFIYFIVMIFILTWFVPHTFELIRL
jgi:hypothetical protein